MKTTVTRAYQASSRMTVKRRALMLSCATLAIATVALAPQKAHAQAFNGTLTSPPSSGTRVYTATGSETIVINNNASGAVTLNWTPDDGSTSGNINFLPSGNIATFTSNMGSEYTVLNRVVPTDPTRAIELNGSVISTVAGSSTIGGNIWFYSPGGIVVGSEAYFDVGGLLLSTIDIAWSTNSGGFSADFLAIEPQAGAIQIMDGAQINALQQNSYVALVAPLIEQGGNVQVNGTAAYVAADRATMTMDQGLFDIQVQIGTDDANGIIHTGTTGGPASTDATTDPHRIFMVAVPKNQALTMLLGGNIGFGEAVSASVENGMIVLASGWSPYDTSSGIGATGSDTYAGIHIGTGTYTSDVQAYATGDIVAAADSGSISFTGDLNLRSLYAGETGNVTVHATNGYSLTIGGDAYLYTTGATYTSGVYAGADNGSLSIVGNALLGAGAAADGTPGTADLYAYNSGGVTVGGTTQIYTNRGAASPDLESPSADNYGGDVNIIAESGGTLTLSAVEIDASADGQQNIGNGDGSAGDAYGGDVNINAGNGGSITMTSLYASVDGRGGDMLDGGLVGGSGYAGSINIGVGDGSVSMADTMYLSALGIGGSYSGEGTPSSALGGTGEGGWIEAYVWGPGSFSVGGYTTMQASGIGGSAQTGGAGYGGNAGITTFDGTAQLADVGITVEGMGGNANAGYGGNGGLAEGGTGWIEARGNEGNIEVPDSTSTITAGDVSISANGFGGVGGESNGDNIAAGTGGSGAGGLYTGELGTGGAFTASANGSTLQLGNVYLEAQGFGGTGGSGSGILGGGDGGEAFGGSAEMGNYGPIGTASSASYGDISLNVSAFGGAGGTGAAGQGAGGNAIAGGSIYDEAQNRWGGAYISAIGNVSVGAAVLYADAWGGAGSTGGNAVGGIAQAASWNDTNSVMDFVGDVWISGYAAGGSGDVGGDAVGGYSGLGAIGGETGATLNVSGQTQLFADAAGGVGVTSGGVGTGGVAELLADDGSITANTIYVTTRGNGGDSANSAGLGTGGEIYFTVTDGGTLDAGTFEMLASGYGGDSELGDAGAGMGGTLTALVQGAVVSNSFIAWADGIGGSSVSGAGGSGTGGTSGLTIDGGTISVSGHTNVTADGVGGVGASGGAAQGGDATVEMTANGGSFTGNYIETHTLAWGGDSTGAGAGGAATGGTTLFDIAATLNEGATASVTLGSMNANSNGAGGNGTGESGAAGGSGTGGDVTVNFGAATVAIAGQAVVSAYGDGGDGAGGATGGAGGGGTGGIALVDTGTGTATFGTLVASSSASGGAGGAGADGAGGAGGNATAGSTAFVEIDGDATIGTVRASASAFAGSGGTGTTAGVGGNANAGHASVDVFDGATLTSATTVDVLSNATGGSGSTGGDATAGTSGFGIYGTGSANLNAANINSIAEGGDGTSGNGGTAEGGLSNMLVQGSATLAGLNFDATANAGAGAIGGAATGGDAVLTIDGGSASAGVFGMYANGVGGAGVAGGEAVGGLASISYSENGGLLSLGDFSWIEAAGTGGTGTTGAGGQGTGGVVDIAITAGATLQTDFLVAYSLGAGGDSISGPGGAGVGSSATTVVTTGGELDVGDFYLFADAGGGASVSGTGGNGQAGDAQLVLDGGTLTTAGDTLVTADAGGGQGAIGGDGTAGTASMTITSNGGTATGGTLMVNTYGFGGAGTAGAGGDGAAGTSVFEVASTLNSGAVATVDVAGVSVNANSKGGASTGGTGGTGTGGTASIVLGSGNTTTSGNLGAYAQGTGGAGFNGGFGAGGTAGVTVASAASLTNSGNGVDVSADAFGGAGSTGFGGNAQAGSASIQSGGTWTASGEVFVSADGEGGDGGAGGGDGYAGDSALRVYASTAQLSGGVTIRAAGTGGSSANGTGGDGVGGYARASAYQGGTIIANNFTVDSSGSGGSGVDGGAGHGGENIEGWGGSVLQSLDEGSSITLTGQTNIVSNGSGGAATGSEGLGGDASGGYAGLGANSSAPITLGAALIEANGTGGTGAGGAGTGTGGNTELSSDGAPVTGGAIVMHADGSTQGGTVRVESTNGGDLQATALTASANGGLYAGDMLVDVGSGSAADFGVAHLSSTGSIPGSDEDGIEIDVVGQLTATSLTLASTDDIMIATYSGGQILVDGTIEAVTPGLVRILDDGNAGLVQSNVINLDGGQLQLTGNIAAFDAFLTLDGNYDLANLIATENGLSITAGGAITAAETVYYDGNLTVNAGTSLTVTGMVVDGSLSLNAAQGIQAGSLTADGNLALDAGGNLAASNLTAGGGIAAEAGGTLTVQAVTSGYSPPVSVDSIQTTAVVTGENVTLSSTGNMTTGAINSGEGIALTSGGTLTTGQLNAVAAIGATSVGDMLLAGASGSSVTLAGQANVTSGNIVSSTTVDASAVGNLTLNGVSAATSATLTSGGMASFLGLVSAPLITVTSANINIGEGGQLGEAGVTDVLNLFATSNSPVIVGGSSSESGYHLSQDEAERIEAEAVSLTAQGTGTTGPDVIVHDLTIGGSQTDGGGVAQVVLTTSGNIIVDGDVLYANAAATDSMSLNAGNSIQVITDTGSVAMTASDDSLSGTLLLTADNIWVGDEALVDQLAANPNFSGRDEALATNNGTDNPDGNLRAGGITATVSETLLVQNSGTDEDFAGVSVGDGGLTVNNAGSSPATVIAYGRQVKSDGTVVEGEDFSEAVNFTGNSVSGDSRVNGCTVGGSCAGDTDVPSIPGPEAILGPIGLMTNSSDGSPADGGSDEGENEGEDEEEGGEDEGSVDPSVRLINSGPLQLDKTVDQPVTSGSDAMLIGGTN